MKAHPHRRSRSPSPSPLAPPPAADLLDRLPRRAGERSGLPGRARAVPGHHRAAAAGALGLPAAHHRQRASIFRNDIDREGAPDFDYTYQDLRASRSSQPIFRMQNWIAIDQAREDRCCRPRPRSPQAQQDLALRVAQAYFDVLLAQDNVALSESQKTAIDQQLAQAKRNFEVGTATIVDTLEAQARYDQSVAKEIADKNDLEVKRRALAGAARQAARRPRAAARAAAARPAHAQRHRGLGEGRRASRASRSRSARANYEIAQQEVDRQRAGHLPDRWTSPAASRAPTTRPRRVPPASRPDHQRAARIGLTLVDADLPAAGSPSRACARRWRCATAPSRTSRTPQRTVAQTVRASFLIVTSGIAQVRALEQALGLHAEPARLHHPRARRGRAHQRRRAERAAAGVPDAPRPAAGALQLPASTRCA